MVRPVTRTHRLAVSWVSASTHRRVRRPPARAHVRPPQGRRRPDQRDRSHVSDRRKRGLFCCCAAGVAEVLRPQITCWRWAGYRSQATLASAWQRVYRMHSGVPAQVLDRHLTLSGAMAGRERLR